MSRPASTHPWRLGLPNTRERVLLASWARPPPPATPGNVTALAGVIESQGSQHKVHAPPSRK